MFEIKVDVVITKIELPTCPNVFAKVYYLDCETLDLPDRLGSLLSNTLSNFTDAYNREGKNTIKLMLKSVVELKGSLYKE